MTKAEMETHRTEYHALMAEAGSALQDGLYRRAVELALSSWDHIDGMMQYERKYEDRDFASIEGIDLILKHAPLLFDFQSLDALESLLKSQRRIEKNTSDNMAGKLAKARAMMWNAHRMWDHLEQHPGSKQDELRRVLGGNQDRWRSVAQRLERLGYFHDKNDDDVETVAQAWERMGLLRRTPAGGSYCLELIQ